MEAKADIGKDQRRNVCKTKSMGKFRNSSEETDHILYQSETGPYHEFLLLSSSDYAVGDWEKVSNEIHTADAPKHRKFPMVARLSDDFVWHINDQIAWIDTINPAMGNEPVTGLCHYGITAITRSGAPVATAVFGGWARLLKNGPETLEVTGPTTFTGGSDNFVDLRTAKVTKLQYSRDALVEQLFRLEDFAKQVCSKHRDLYILHFGI